MNATQINEARRIIAETHPAESASLTDAQIEKLCRLAAKKSPDEIKAAVS